MTQMNDQNQQSAQTSALIEVLTRADDQLIKRILLPATSYILVVLFYSHSCIKTH